MRNKQKIVGIITFHCADNFGAFLQTYALQQTIQKIGAYCEVIDYRPYTLIEPYLIKTNWSKKSIVSFIKRYVYAFLYRSKILKRIQLFEQARQRLLVLSPRQYQSHEDLHNYPPKYDVYITGSDQVWNEAHTGVSACSYFLDFAVPGSRCVSYAASLGERQRPEFEKLFKPYLSSFFSVSVREKSFVKYVGDLSHVPIDRHIDPALLLTREEWDSVAAPCSFVDSHSEGYVFVYMMVRSSGIVQLAKRIAREKGWKILYYGRSGKYGLNAQSIMPCGPLEFISLVANAQVVLTSSFHGIIFSVIYRKNFFCFPFPRRQERISDLLEMLGLENRLLSTDKECADLTDIFVEVDFSNAARAIEREKSRSIDYLQTSVLL